MMWHIRQATEFDAEILTALRLEFLAEIGYGGEGVQEAVRDYFERALRSGEFRAWLAESEGQIVGTGGVIFVQKPPHVRNLSGREAHVLNMYTLPQYRRQGIATALLETIRQHLVTLDVTCLRLHTTVGAKRVYHGQGFRSDTSEMVLHLPHEGAPAGSDPRV